MTLNMTCSGEDIISPKVMGSEILWLGSMRSDLNRRTEGVKHILEIGIHRASKACTLMMLSNAPGTMRTWFRLVL
jgi:hypothetical protein